MDSANGTKNRLNEAIIATGRQRKWIADQVGVSRVTLHRWCHDAYPVPDEQQQKLVAVLFPEIPEGEAREAKQRELFPEEAMVGA